MLTIRKERGGIINERETRHGRVPEPAVSLNIVPFTVQLPSGYSLSAAGSGTQATTATGSSSSDATSKGGSSTAKASDPIDVVSISNAATAGMFTAVTGDIYRMSELFKASAPTGQTIAGYRVALGASGGGAQLQLNGDPVIDGRTSFTAEEFAHLTYTTGDTGSQQSLMVVAQTGTRLPVPTDSPAGTLGALIHETDSQALQITANVTGSRSINAMNALTGTNVLDVSLTGADAAIAGIVQGAGIFNGFIGTARPSLQTDMTPEPPLSLSALADATGTYRSAGLSPANSDIDLLALYSTAIGSSVAPGVFSSSRGPLATALLLLGGTATGAFQTADNLNALAQAIRAYNTTKGF
jgi:hypothetical protein